MSGTPPPGDAPPGDPKPANPFDGPYATGATEYEKYLRVDELLALQKPPERRTHADELMFQTIHQVEELWMKWIIHELGEAVVYLDGDRLAEAGRAIGRAVAIEEMLSRQLELFQTMLPTAYLDIRRGLGRGGGLDSTGFKRINEVAPVVWSCFQRCLERNQVDLLEMYQQPTSRPDYLAVAEAMISFDAQMQRFKKEHIMTVRRIIGIGTASLRGNPIEMLERSAQLTYFPMLWAVRDRMYIDFKAGPLEG
jgi:tryptophan 2,3-dioxygenase